MRRPRRRFHPLLAALVAAVVAAVATAACGGGDGSGSGSGSGEASAPAVRIEDFSFRPGELRVSAGSTVTFTNRDGFAHTVTAKDRSYDSKNLAEGATFEHRYDEAGTYEYFCAIHNSMTGSIVVG